MKWPSVRGGPWIGSPLIPAVDFTDMKIEAGKTLFPLQFI